MKGGDITMKKLLIVLVVVAVCSFLFVGCALTDWLTPDTPVIPDAMEAVATAELTEDKTEIEWSIVNVGNVFIREYTLTFTVDYPDVTRDYVVITHEGEYLEVGAFEEGTVELAEYGWLPGASEPGLAEPESVSVTWELFN